MKFEQVSLIYEQSIYLVSSKEFFYKNESAKKMMTKNLVDFIVVVMGKCIKCELAGVRSFSYSCFEALKAKDKRLEPVPHYNDNEKIRKDSKLSSSLLIFLLHKWKLLQKKCILNRYDCEVARWPIIVIQLIWNGRMKR